MVTPNPRSTLIWQLAVLVVAVAGLAYLLVSLGVFKAPEQNRQVKFRVESSGGYATITMTDDKHKNGESALEQTPWERTGVYQNGNQVYLTAANPAQVGTLSCTILINNKVWKRDVAGSPKDKVACAGIVP